MTLESINTVAVLGLGTMGHGIAQAFATAGLRVRCFDGSAAFRASLHERVRANLRQMVQAGIVAETAIAPALECITLCASEADAVGPAQFVTEAIFEDLPLKQDLFARLERMVSEQTILASNSSSFPISRTALRMHRPERAVLTHWFNPPHIVPVVEVVPGEKTAPATADAAYALLERIGKLPVRLHKEIPGFLVNRVQVAMFREVWDLLDRGIASAEQIDRAIRGSMGLRLAALGPLEIIDFAGLDITARVYENLAPDLRADAALHAVVRDLVNQGHFGVKTGKGIFDYPPEVAAARQARRDKLYLGLVRLLKELDEP